MKLLYFFLAVLATAVAEEDLVQDVIADSEALASVELLKTAADSSGSASNNYVPPSQRPPKAYNPQQVSQQNNWNPQQIAQQNNWPTPPPNSWTPPQNTWTPPQNSWTPPQNTWTPPQNTWTPPENTWKPPENVWNPPQNTWTPPQNSWNPPNYVPQNPWGQQGPNQPGVQHDAPTNSWTSTTPVAVIKNEQYYGDNGSYKYEYQTGDGTHVGEEGYLNNPRTDNESLVKKGWYSYVGGDGKTYTVTWWADETGFHASGDHLPKPPPVPPAIQAAIEQNAKEEAAKLEAEKNKQPVQYPQQTYPQQTYPQQTYPQQTYPQQTYPQQTYPQQTYPQQTYPQQTYPQQTYPQQTHPQQQNQPTYG